LFIDNRLRSITLYSYEVNASAAEPGCLQSATAEHLGILEALKAKDGPLTRERKVAQIVVRLEFLIRTVLRASASIPPE